MKLRPWHRWVVIETAQRPHTLVSRHRTWRSAKAESRRRWDEYYVSGLIDPWYTPKTRWYQPIRRSSWVKVSTKTRHSRRKEQCT